MTGDAPGFATPSRPSDGASTRREHWWLLVATFVLSLGSNAYIIAPAAIAPRLVSRYGVSKSAIGLAVSAFLLSGLVVQIPSGFLMDRRDTTRLATAAVGVFAAAAVGGWFVPGYAGLVGSRLVAGLSLPFTFIMLTDVVASTFPADTRGFATSVFTASAPTGFALGQFATPPLIALVDVETAFLLYPVVSVAGLALFLWVAPEDAGPEEPLRVAELRGALWDRSLVLLSVSAMCFYSVYFFLNSWIPSYANESLSVPLTAVGSLAALIPVTGVIARPAGGWLSDAIGGRRRPVIVLSSVVSLPLFLAILQISDRFAFGTVLLTMGFTLQFAMGVYYIFAKEVAPPDATRTGLAFFGTLSFLGNVVAPVTGGLLVDAVGWPLTFGVYAALGVLGVVTLLAVDESG